MPDFRRNYVPGGTYFFTAVTDGRRPFLTTDLGRDSLRQSTADVRRQLPFKILAFVLLPDHLHTIWTLPPEDADYSTRWKKIKERFTRAFLKAGGEEGQRSDNHRRHRGRAVWQHRFWEHTIRDEGDLKRCVDYVHWNPVKHGLAPRAGDYPWSSFHQHVKKGEYAPDWGTAEPKDVPGAEWE